MADGGDRRLVSRLRLAREGRRVLGPGRADLLEGLRDTGSIAAAGRRMGMSYKRAWSLVEDLNAAFDAPLVQVHRGGAGHGGAALTELGLEVLERFRRIERQVNAATARDVEALNARLAR